MITAYKIINVSIPTILTSDDPDMALRLMDEFRVGHLPVVENGKFLGLASETALLSAEEKVSEKDQNFSNLIVTSISPNEHILEVLKLVSEQHLSLIPVVDDQLTYIGAITLEDLVDHLSQMQGASRRGGIIVLEMTEKDYSLQQIARIVEENDAKILSTSVSPGDDGQIEVNLKISEPDVNAILQSFARFNYNIKASYQEPEYTEDLQKRYEELMRYLNI